MVNSVTYQGRTVAEMELKKTQGGIDYVNFKLAWNEKYKEQEKTCFLRCKAWRQTATFIDKFFHDKGSELIVEGHLETENWEDNDGNKRSENVLMVERAHFCGKRQSGGNGQASAPSAASGFTPAGDDEPLPF